MLFSILIPMYNAEAHIGRCIESVLNQKEKDFELVIINDGSKDKSRQVVESYILHDNRIRLINKKNEGSFHARCSAVREAKGEYAIFLDSDDTLKSNALSKIKEEIESADLDIIIYRAEAIDENGRVSEFPPLFESGRMFYQDNKQDIYYALLRGASCINVMWIKAIRINCFDKNICQNTPRISVSDDFLYSLGPLTNAKSVKYIDDILYEYRYNKESIMRNFQPEVYVGIQFVYSELKKYMIKWGLTSNYDWSLFYNKYISAVASILLYSKASLKGKREDYIKTVKQIQQDVLFKDIYDKAFKQTKSKYKIPLFLAKHKCYEVLVILYHFVTKVRKISGL